MSRAKRLAWLCAPAACLAVTCMAVGDCKLLQVAEFSVSDNDNRLLLDGQINDQPIKIRVDTGSSSSVMWEDQARHLGLPLASNPYFHTYGVSGTGHILETKIKHLQIGAFSFKDQAIAVLGTSGDGRSSDESLILGEDFLSKFTTEFDLAHHAIRLLRPEGCQPEQLVYWDKTFSMADFEPTNPDQPSIELHVTLNGQRVRAWLDSGAATSIISTAAARKSGVTPGEKGTHEVGRSVGIAGKAMETWVGMFDTIAVGDESVRNVKLRIAPLFDRDKEVPTGSIVAAPVAEFPSMLLGADFFRSHRIMVMFKERKVLFTYNGGPIFQVMEPNPNTVVAPMSGSRPSTETNGNTPVPGNTPAK